MTRARLFISGRVQGVFFRKSAQKEAENLGLGGFAENLPDGRVECLVEGPEDRINQFIEWAHKGPMLARVDDVEVRWEESDTRIEGFEVR